MPLTIIREDITKIKVDAIVNAANTNLQMGGGVCGAIFSVAGAKKLQKACDKLAPIQTGEAVITDGLALPSKYIIHAAGPIYRGGNHNEEQLLSKCYLNSLELAKKHGAKSIAFPLISSGIYGYPKDEALSVATKTVGEWLMKNDMDVSLVVFDKGAFSVSQNLLGDVETFIDQNYVDQLEEKFSRSEIITECETISEKEIMDVEWVEKELLKLESDSTHKEMSLASLSSPYPTELEKFIQHLDEPFSATLLKLIDEKGKTDVEVYKRANIDRKLFSKIRTGKSYTPSKKTIVALAIALELSLPETHDLLSRAGFTLSKSVLFDVIIEYFILRRKYNIFEINNVLFQYDQPILGGQ